MGQERVPVPVTVDSEDEASRQLLLLLSRVRLIGFPGPVPPGPAVWAALTEVVAESEARIEALIAYQDKKWNDYINGFKSDRGKG